MRIKTLSRLFVVPALVAAPAFSFAQAAPATGKAQIVVAEVGFATPESVEYSAADDTYLVANINGDPFGADNNGFISKVSPEGKVVTLKWIEGGQNGVTLNAPKGMTIVKGNLYVADIDTVRVFDAASGKPVRTIAINGATFLNGMAAGSKGDAVYVTDSGFNAGFAASGTDAIHRVRLDGAVEKIANGKDMGHPNGVWDDNGTILYVTFGSGKLMAIGGAKPVSFPAPPAGQLDGLVQVKGGRTLVSSWEGKAIYALGGDKKFTTLADSLDAPADLGVDTKRNRLLIPLFQQNKIVIQPL